MSMINCILLDMHKMQFSELGLINWHNATWKQNRLFPHTHTDHKDPSVFSQDALVVTWGLLQKYTTHCCVYATTFNGHLQIQQLDETRSSQHRNQKGQRILTQWLHSNASVHSKNILGPRLVCISSGTFYSRTSAPCWQKTGAVCLSGVHYMLVLMLVCKCKSVACVGICL